MAGFLASNNRLQNQLRTYPSLLPEAIDEILRLSGPLISNRRKATRHAEINGRRIKQGDSIHLNWVSANRDNSVFNDADEFRLGRDPSKNLLYGFGIHFCPGAPLARLELSCLMQALLHHFVEIRPDTNRTPVLAIYPDIGFSSLPLLLRRFENK